MSAIDRLLDNKFLLHDILKTYAEHLRELKYLHRINCPQCYETDKPCKKYYWICLDLSEIEFLVKELEREYKQLPR